MSPDESLPKASNDDQPCETVWYADGLRFTCSQCGQCCTGSPGYVWVDDSEIAEIARFLGTSVGEVKLLHARSVGTRTSLREFANGDCIYFDGRTRGCRIYPVRPKQCKTWPFWNSNLSTPQAWNEVTTTCPGAGRGELVTLDEIRKRSSEIDL